MLPLVNECSVFDFSCGDGFVTFPFFRGGHPLENALAPVCGLSLLSAGSMRFRWNESNPSRDSFLSRVCSLDTGASGKKRSDTRIVPLELIHSRAVYALDVSQDGSARVIGKNDCRVKAEPLRTGDGIVACDSRLVPVVTVADCVPLYLYDPVSGCFALVHSGWKGTGIVCDAIALAAEVYGASASDFCVVIGPHIHSCCYSVAKDRADFFAERYGAECVLSSASAYSLSLASANIALLLDAGVQPGNILHCTDCTCCDSRFGSFRRETAGLPPQIPLEERLRHFTPMAAFIKGNAPA